MKLEQFVVASPDGLESLIVTPGKGGFSVEMEEDHPDDYRYIERTLTHDEALTLILFLAQHIDHDKLQGDDDDAK